MLNTYYLFCLNNLFFFFSFSPSCTYPNPLWWRCVPLSSFAVLPARCCYRSSPQAAVYTVVSLLWPKSSAELRMGTPPFKSKLLSNVLLGLFSHLSAALVSYLCRLKSCLQVYGFMSETSSCVPACPVSAPLYCAPWPGDSYLHS